MALSEDQQALVADYANRLLGDALSAPGSPAAQVLTEFMVATEERRLEMLKDWASQQRNDEDQTLEDQRTRLTRMEEERDTRLPVLDSIADMRSL